MKGNLFSDPGFDPSPPSFNYKAPSLVVSGVKSKQFTLQDHQNLYQDVITRAQANKLKSQTQACSPKEAQRQTNKKAKDETFVKRLQLYQNIFKNENYNSQTEFSSRMAQAKHSSTQEIQIDNLNDYDENEEKFKNHYVSVPIKNYSFMAKQNLKFDLKMAQIINAKIEGNTFKMFGISKGEPVWGPPVTQTDTMLGSPGKIKKKKKKKKSSSRSPENQESKNESQMQVLSQKTVNTNGSASPDWSESIPKSLKPTLLAFKKGAQSTIQQQLSSKKSQKHSLLFGSSSQGDSLLYTQHTDQSNHDQIRNFRNKKQQQQQTSVRVFNDSIKPLLTRELMIISRTQAVNKILSKLSKNNSKEREEQAIGELPQRLTTAALIHRHKLQKQLNSSQLSDQLNLSLQTTQIKYQQKNQQRSLTNNEILIENQKKNKQTALIETYQNQLISQDYQSRQSSKRSSGTHDTTKAPALDRITKSGQNGIEDQINSSSGSFQGISGIYLTYTSSNPYIESSASTYSAINKGANQHQTSRRLTQIPPSALNLLPDSNKSKFFGCGQIYKQASNEFIPQIANGAQDKAIHTHLQIELPHNKVLIDGESRRGSCFVPMNIQDENSIREWERLQSDQTSSKFISESSKGSQAQIQNFGNQGNAKKINDQILPKSMLYQTALNNFQQRRMTTQFGSTNTQKQSIAQQLNSSAPISNIHIY